MSWFGHAPQARDSAADRAEVLATALDLRSSGDSWFHGFQLAKDLAGQTGARKLVSHGTLYKALGRLEEAGLLSSECEDPEVAIEEGRPRRRLSRVTGAVERALAGWRAQQTRTRTSGRPGLEPT